jgi:O-antigen/teichoic acid export membrane protein
VKLYKAGFYYIVSDALFGGMPVLLTPLLSYYITPEDFAVYINLTVIMMLSSVVIDFGSAGYFGVIFHNKKIVNKTVFKNAIISMVVNAALFMILTYLFIDDISSFVGSSRLHVYISILIGFCTSVNALYLTKIRFNEKVILFFNIRVLQVLFHAILAIILVVFSDQSWTGRYVAHFVPIFLLFLWVVKNNRGFFKEGALSYGTKSFGPQLFFGLTLMPHALSSWVKTGFDRLYLTDTVGLLSNGIYSTAFQISMISSLIGVGFNKVLAPRMFLDLEQNDGKELKKILPKVITYNVYFTILIVLFFQFTGSLLLPDSYHASLVILPYLLVAQGLLNIYVVYSNLMFFYKFTIKLSLVSISSAIIHVFLLEILVVEYDEFGATISFLISAMVQMALIVIFIKVKLKNDYK